MAQDLEHKELKMSAAGMEGDHLLLGKSDFPERQRRVRRDTQSIPGGDGNPRAGN